MRKRIEQKLYRRLRLLQHRESALVSIVLDYIRSGIPLVSALRIVALDPGAGWHNRGTAAKVLALSDPGGTVRSLLDLFFIQTGKTELLETALTIEWLGDRAAVRPLVGALYDANPDRRRAAARALGWIPGAGKRAAKALVRVLSANAQPQAVREEAAESLAYLHYGQAIPPLIAVLDHSAVRIRFWSVFALGSIGRSQFYARGHTDPRALAALKRMLSDEEIASGWWSVGREALSMLGPLEPAYHDKLDHESRRVLHDPDASPEDLRWAGGHKS